MEYSQFEPQMRRLAAAYRVDINPPTIAAYWTIFASTDAERFRSACERVISHERIFPPIAALKELIRQQHEVARGDTNLLSASGSVGCLTCGDAGFVKRDVPVSHPEFGRAIPCPHCEGAKKPRNHKAEYLAFLERDHATQPPLPPAGVGTRGATPEPPPEGFAKPGVPVPLMLGEAERERRRRLIAANIAAVAKKMKGG